ncbi:MAG: NAD-dependent protein deacylase [Clostridiaceae bacterium]
MNDIDIFKNIIMETNNIVFFGGAGVSTESNIPDFRSENGLYKTKNNYSFPPDIMLSHSFFQDHTEDFYDFYKNKLIYKDAKPNKAHYALAKLEKMGKLKAVVTQNIDGLHQTAGSKNVLELHGSVHNNYCLKCGKTFNLDYVINSESIIPYCDNCKNIVRPDVVLYEEYLDDGIVEAAGKYISNADVLIVGGTSLVVFPAANMINQFRGKKLILINKTATPADSSADLVFHCSIGDIMSKVINNLS